MGVATACYWVRQRVIVPHRNVVASRAGGHKKDGTMSEADLEPTAGDEIESDLDLDGTAGDDGWLQEWSLGVSEVSVVQKV